MTQRTKTILFAVALLAALLAVYTYERMAARPAGTDPTGRAGTVVEVEPREGERAIVRAFRERRSNLWVESAGVVERMLPDDLEGSRHQRFIVRMESGHTVLVSHNIDLAPRVPVSEGQPVAFRGEYEWNDRGGVIHWTHHDPRGNLAGGWILHEGTRYR